MASADEQFQSLLNSYRSNYMQYVVTGQGAYKTAYEKVYDQIEQMIQARAQQVNNEKTAASQFLNNFKQDNDEIQGMRDQVHSMVEDVQQTKNQYESAKSRYENTDVLTSLSPKNEIGLGIVLRLGILILLIPIFFILGYFYPSEGAGWAAIARQQTAREGQVLAATVRELASPMMRAMSPTTQGMIPPRP